MSEHVVVVSRQITVRLQMPGFHAWPAAPEHRAYLRDQHRHLFHIEATIHVGHGDREVEFHDLQDATREAFQSAYDALPDSRSCEHLAEHTARLLIDRLDLHTANVGVWEDGECGAHVSVSRVLNPEVYE